MLDYLHVVKSRGRIPSDSFFKHTVYGLRYAYRIFGMEQMRVMLPSIERPKKLPVVLSRSEVKQLLKSPALLKHRLVLAMLYGCGLRCSELRNLELKDLDFDREMLHVRQGKGRKDRYVPLSTMQVRGLKRYMAGEHPVTWCFAVMIKQVGQPRFPCVGYNGSFGRPAGRAVSKKKSPPIA